MSAWQLPSATRARSELCDNGCRLEGELGECRHALQLAGTLHMVCYAGTSHGGSAVAGLLWRICYGGSAMPSHLNSSFACMFQVQQLGRALPSELAHPLLTLCSSNKPALRNAAVQLLDSRLRCRLGQRLCTPCMPVYMHFCVHARSVVCHLDFLAWTHRTHVHTRFSTRACIACM